MIRVVSLDIQTHGDYIFEPPFTSPDIRLLGVPNTSWLFIYICHPNMRPHHQSLTTTTTTKTTTGRSNADGDPTNGCEVSCPEVAHGLCVHCGGDAAIIRFTGKAWNFRRDPEVTNGRSITRSNTEPHLRYDWGMVTGCRGMWWNILIVLISTKNIKRKHTSMGSNQGCVPT